LKKKFKNISIRCLNKNDRVAYCLVSAVLLVFPFAVLGVLKTPLGRFFGCAFLRITGKPCMFCGMTRSLENCIKLDFGHALQWHVFGPVFFAGYIILLMKYLIGSVIGYTIDIRIHESKTRNMIFYIIGSLVFICWILRLLNVPFFIFPY